MMGTYSCNTARVFLEGTPMMGTYSCITAREVNSPVHIRCARIFGGVTTYTATTSTIPISPTLTPPHYRAAWLRGEATVPSIYHSLLPAGTPPLLPIPLPAPSTSRRADIPEADTSPRKRLLLTAPTPRVKVGESSAARQPGSTMARRVDHSFVDTVDTRVQDTERRTMASVEALEAGARVDTLEDTGSSA
ncbi:hypothetical protein Tco_1247159 [Tanacetum coccineum]